VHTVTDAPALASCLADLEAAPAGVVALFVDDEASDAPDAAEAAVVDGLEQLQVMLQAAEGWGSAPPPTWWITRGGAAVTGFEEPALTASSVLGFGRSWISEQPQWKATLVDLPPGTAPETDLLWSILSAPAQEPQLAIRDGALLAPRLLRPSSKAARGLTVPDSESYDLVVSEAGALDRLNLAPRPARPPGPGEVQVEVRASGLNFRDVLEALGMVPWAPTALGGECAGVVTAIGEGVEHLAVGEAVMGLAAGGMSKRVTVDARQMVRQPKSLTPEQAAGVPVVFLTAWYGLADLAGLKANQRVLIHAAAGGVGIAAVQLAHLWGAEVYGTASLPKWDLVRSLGVEHIANSRDLSFVEAFQKATNGEGFDVVLNSLAGEFVDASADLLKPGGYFAEMGKRDIRPVEQMAESHPGIRYHAYDVEDPGLDRIQAMLVAVAEAYDAGQLEPLPLRTFPLTEVEGAMRFMGQAKHVGKLVITQPHQSIDGLRGDGTVLITGGLGALGLLTAGWLVEAKGARHLILLGRSAPTGERLEAVEALRASGATVTVASADISDRGRLAEIIGGIDPEHPLRGVVHAAGVLDDGVISQQTPERIARVFAPKVRGAWHLHDLTRDLDLDLFVIYSSAASLLGSPGQCNYAAANAFCDGLAWRRRAAGLPALSINWAAWSGGGLASATMSSADWARMSRQGFGAIQPADGVALLEAATFHGEPQLGVLPLDLGALRKLQRLGPIPSILRDLVGSRAAGPSAAAGAKSSALIQKLKDAPPGERQATLESALQVEVARILALSSANDVSVRRPLRDFGLDSLMAVELRNTVSLLVGEPLPATLLFDYPTVEKLAAWLITGPLGLGEATEAEGGSEGDTSYEEQLGTLSDLELMELAAAEFDLDDDGS